MKQREIKFRAWDKVNKQMLTVHTWSNTTLVVLDWRNMKNPAFNKEASPQREIDNWKEKGIILIQYTGLKDKNSKEIFEGDIVKVAKNNNLPYEVGWWIDKWSILDESQAVESLCAWGTSGLEVIGNIFEKTNLLTTK